MYFERLHSLSKRSGNAVRKLQVMKGISSSYAGMWRTEMTRRRLLAFVVDWMGPKCSVASAEPSPGSDRMRAAACGRSAGGRLEGDGDCL